MYSKPNSITMLYKKNILFSAVMGLLFLFLFSSCKKDAPAAAPDPFYEVYDQWI